LIVLCKLKRFSKDDCIKIKQLLKAGEGKEEEIARLMLKAEKNSENSAAMSAQDDLFKELLTQIKNEKIFP